MGPEFSEKTKRQLAARAAYRCNNPTCRALTVAPHSDGVQAVILGDAAHIYGARPGAARHPDSANRRSATPVIGNTDEPRRNVRYRSDEQTLRQYEHRAEGHVE